MNSLEISNAPAQKGRACLNTPKTHPKKKIITARNSENGKFREVKIHQTPLGPSDFEQEYREKARRTLGFVFETRR